MPATLIQAHLDAFSQQRRIRAGSLIISAFGDAIYPRGGRIWLGSLIRLLEPLGVGERLIRTTVFRLAQDGWLRTEAHGRRADYLLTPAGQQRIEDAARHIYASSTPVWDRRWRLMLVVGDIAGRQRDQLRRALFWQGFGLLGTDCFIHPSADLDAASDALMADGMGELLHELMPLLAVENHFGNSARDVDMVLRAWNLEQLGNDYAEFVARYRPLIESLRQHVGDVIPDETAFLLRTVLIHEYRRLLLRDPELPAELLPHDWPGNEARLMCREFYRRLLQPSERHLDQQLQCANGHVPAAQPLLYQRFQTEDPFQNHLRPVP